MNMVWRCDNRLGVGDQFNGNLGTMMMIIAIQNIQLGMLKHSKRSESAHIQQIRAFAMI
jgi:secreted protein with Ig-like and vWFA domain